MDIIIADKTYVAPAIKARMVRKAVEIAEKTNFNNLKVAELDNLIDFTVEVFGNQFTRDDVYDGLEANRLVPAIVDSIQGVVGTMNNKLGQFPNGQTGE